MSKVLAFLLGALVSLCWPAWTQQVPDPLSKTAPAVITDKKSAAITADAAAFTALSQGGATAQQIYQMTTTVPVATYDALRGVTVVPSGSTNEGVTGLGTYVLNNHSAGAGGNAGNAVGLFSVGISAANGAHTWGINTLLQDSTIPGVLSSSSGRELWNELDFNVTSTSTVVRGLVLTGASIAQPALATGVEVRPLGVGSKWAAAFATQGGAATTGLALGPQGAAGTLSSPSQYLLLGWSDGAGTVHTHSLQSSVGALTLDLTGPAGTGNLFLSKGGFKTLDGGSQAGLVLGTQNTTGVLSDSQSAHFSWANAAGAPFNVALQVKSADGLLHVLTSGGPTTGGIDLPANARYSVNGVVGVSCAGPPTAGFAVVGGIVTAC